MRPVVIVLEGPDGAGKSTLADNLQQLTGYDQIHLSAPVGETAYELCARHVMSVLNTGNNTIFDRLHVSEPIYGPVARGVDTMGEDGHSRIERVLWNETRPVFVLCLPPFMRALANWDERNKRKGEMLTNTVDFISVYRGYEAAHRRTTLPVLVYDYTKHGAEDLLFRLRVMGLVT
jgi:thymidylate kinase